MTNIDQQAVISAKAPSLAFGKSQRGFVGDGAFLAFLGQAVSTGSVQLPSALRLDTDMLPKAPGVTVAGSDPKQPTPGISLAGDHAPILGSDPVFGPETNSAGHDSAKSTAIDSCDNQGSNLSPRKIEVGATSSSLVLAQTATPQTPHAAQTSQATQVPQISLGAALITAPTAKTPDPDRILVDQPVVSPATDIPAVLGISAHQFHIQTANPPRPPQTTRTDFGANYNPDFSPVQPVQTRTSDVMAGPDNSATPAPLGGIPLDVPAEPQMAISTDRSATITIAGPQNLPAIPTDVQVPQNRWPKGEDTPEPAQGQYDKGAKYGAVSFQPMPMMKPPPEINAAAHSPNPGPQTAPIASQTAWQVMPVPAQPSPPEPQQTAVLSSKHSQQPTRFGSPFSGIFNPQAEGSLQILHEVGPLANAAAGKPTMADSIAPPFQPPQQSAASDSFRQMGPSPEMAKDMHAAQPKATAGPEQTSVPAAFKPSVDPALQMAATPQSPAEPSPKLVFKSKGIQDLSVLAQQHRPTVSPSSDLPVPPMAPLAPARESAKIAFVLERASYSDAVITSSGQSIGSAPAPAQTFVAPAAHGPVALPALPHHIRQHLTPGKPTSLELSLAPEELGKLRLFMTPDGDKFRIVIQAERPETLELLRRNSDSFTADLRNSGFGGASFSFGGWGDHPPSPDSKKQDGKAQISGTTAEKPVVPARHSEPQKATGLDLRV